MPHEKIATTGAGKTRGLTGPAKRDAYRPSGWRNSEEERTRTSRIRTNRGRPRYPKGAQTKGSTRFAHAKTERNQRRMARKYLRERALGKRLTPYQMAIIEQAHGSPWSQFGGI